MMKQWHALVIASALFMVSGMANTARAEALGLDIGAFGSYLDSEDFGDGLGVGGKLKLNVVEFFAVDVRASYLEYKDYENVSIVPVEGLALLQLPLGDALNFYGGAGVGYYLIDHDVYDFDDSVGFFPVAGLELGFADFKLFGEVRWLMLSADLDDAEQEIQGVIKGDEADVDGIGVNIGIAIDL